MRRSLAALALAAALAACRPHPAPDSPAPPGPAFAVREATIADGLLTVRLTVPLVPPGPKPAIVSPLLDRATLLAAGAVMVDYRIQWPRIPRRRPPEPKPEPGKGVGVWLLAAPTPKTVGRNYLELIDYKARQAVPRVVDYLVTLDDVDPARIAIAGGSTEGFVALEAVAADPRLVAAAAIVACGDYHAFLHGSNLAMKGAPLDLDPEYDRWLADIEPIARPERLLHAALLLVNGRDDRAVPADCAARTVRVLGDAYEAAGTPERFRAVMLEGQGHATGAAALAQVRAWWERWLFDAPDTGDEPDDTEH